MRSLITAMLFMASLGASNSHAAGQTGTLMPANEHVGIIVAADNALGTLTIGNQRYQLTRDVKIHYAQGEDTVGYGKFKFKEDMKIGFKKVKIGPNTETNNINEVWVLFDN